MEELSFTTEFFTTEHLIFHWTPYTKKSWKLLNPNAIYSTNLLSHFCIDFAAVWGHMWCRAAVLQVDDLSVVKLLQQFLPGLDAHAALQFRCTSACSSKTVTAESAVCVQHCTSPRKNTIFVWSHLICTFYYFFQPIHRQKTFLAYY